MATRKRRTFPATACAVSWKLRRWGGMTMPVRQELLRQTLKLLRRARPLVEAVSRKDRDLGSQLLRALSSIPLNTAEGFGSTGGNARLRYRTALGSLYEAQVALAVASVWGYVDEARTAAVIAELEALGGRLYGLARR